MPQTDDALATRVSAALGASYRLGPLIGRGGMGVVYRATDERLRRDVAVKVLPPELAYREDLRRRFVREAQLAAGLSHPHIVSIFDVGEQDGLVWFVMGHVDGESVRAKVERDGPLTQRHATRILREVAWALAYAHAHGIVHRDIKPDNILLEQGTGRAMVTDFGIAKALQGETTGVTASGAVLGSLMYMAPEQAMGEAVDGRADLYGLGLVGYYMLSGRPAFDNATIMNVAARYTMRATPDFSAMPRRPGPQLRGALERCVAPAVGERWVDAEKFLEALGPVGEPPRPMPAPIRRLVRDFMLVPSVGFVALAALTGLGKGTAWELCIWMVLVLAVNGVVTLRSYATRGFGWPELRDAIDREMLSQDEEMQATAVLKERVRIFLYVSSFAGSLGLALTQLLDPLHLDIPIKGPAGPYLSALLFLAMAWPIARINTWIFPRSSPISWQGPAESSEAGKSEPRRQVARPDAHRPLRSPAGAASSRRGLRGDRPRVWTRAGGFADISTDSVGHVGSGGRAALDGRHA